MTEPSESDWVWFRGQFFALCRTKQGNEWEDFVTDAMHARHGGEFIQVDAAGRGDKGCDGYVNGLMLASYGAASPNQDVVSKKITTDFMKARNHWDDVMKRWAFVHNNAAGLPDMALKAVNDLKAQPEIIGEVLLEAWPPQVLLREILAPLSRQQLSFLLGFPPSQEPAGMSYISQCIRGITRFQLADIADEPSEVPFGKIEHNKFGDDVARLIKGSQPQTIHVRRYFDQAFPGEQHQVSQSLSALFDGLAATSSSSDEIFHRLCDELVNETFLGSDLPDQSQQRSAAQLVVVHFFETCQLFEEPPKAG